jgi:hypothetical protein
MADHAPPTKTFEAGRGAKVAVWKNDKGFAITIQSPQYKDQEGNWKSGSIFPTDLPGIIHALELALAYVDSY